MNTSSAVVVVALLEAKPGSEDAVLAALEPAIAAVHGEAGCLTYALHRDTENPSRFVFVEKWTSAVALAAHRTAPHMQELGAKLADLVTGPADVRILTAAPLGDPVLGAL